MRPVLLVLLLCLLLTMTVPVSGISPGAVKTAAPVQASPTSHMTIGPGAVASMIPATTKVPMILTIISDPPQAEIWINGNKTLFKTPMAIPCVDMIAITLKYPGYQESSHITGCWNNQPYTLTVTLVPLATTQPQSTSSPTENPPVYNTPVYPPSVTQQIQTQAGDAGTQTLQSMVPGATAGSQPSQSPAPGTGSLAITTNPTGAKITIDGIPAGASPATIPGLSAGMHNLTITMTGYEDLITQVNIAGGQTMEYSTTLVPATVPTQRKSPGFEAAVAGIALACFVLLKRMT
jgi:hypothetical protein